MKDIYDFLKQKLKEKNVRVDELVKYSGVSRTTIYRMMKGMLEPTRRVYDVFVRMLDLDAKEQQELDYYIKHISVTEDQLLARKALHNMLFQSGEAAERRDGELEIVVYSEAKTIISYNELFATIAEASAHPDFQCEIKIINCARPVILNNLARLLDAENAQNTVVIEHLLALSENERHKNASLIGVILPFLKYERYTMLYSSMDISRMSEHFFSDVMLIRYEYSAEKEVHEKYMVLSFEEEGYSDCWTTDRRTPYEFFLKRYKLLKAQYQSSTMPITNVDFLNDYLIELENMGATYFIKPNPCYHRIPVTALESLMQRLSKRDLSELLTNIGERVDSSFTFDVAKAQLFSNLQYRADLSFAHDQVDIYTKDGLETLARERRLSDHYYYLPSFSKTEVKAILQNIQKKHRDPGDNFRFFITYAPLNDDSLDIIAFENSSVIFIYHSEKYCCKSMNSFFFEQIDLAQTTADFIKNFIPENMVMSQDDADDFIDELIGKYC